MSKPFHIVVWGASGFTGRLVCEHVARDYKGKVNWAMAGRSKEKLESIRAELAEKYGDDLNKTPILIGNLEDQSSLDQIATQTKVIISTAGPFAKYGTPVVNAAVRGKAHYCDITGEVPWVKSMINKHHEDAESKGIRVVNCCGYDSIPSDLGSLLVVNEFQSTLGKLPNQITTAIAEGRGGVSGGTIASAMNQMAVAATEDSTSTYALMPSGEQKGPDNDFWGTEYCGPLGKYLAPFVMQVCNTRIVQRSNYLLGWGGPEFSYKEGVLSKGWASAKMVAFGTIAVLLAFTQAWLHPLLKKIVPAPGEGPSKEQRENGFFKHKVVGESKDGSVVIAEVGDPHRDPGYWSTSRMVLEAGLCLALQQKELDADKNVLHGGVITPAAAMGVHLIERLRAAGFTYEVKEVKNATA